jgi:hypothetical protein
LLNGDDAVISNLDEASEVFIPAVALGELFLAPQDPAVLPKTSIGWSDSPPAEQLSYAISTLLANTEL